MQPHFPSAKSLWAFYHLQYHKWWKAWRKKPEKRPVCMCHYILPRLHAFLAYEHHTVHALLIGPTLPDCSYWIPTVYTMVWGWETSTQKPIAYIYPTHHTFGKYSQDIGTHIHTLWTLQEKKAFWESKEISKNRDPAGDWTQDLLNTSQMLLPIELHVHVYVYVLLLWVIKFTNTEVKYSHGFKFRSTQTFYLANTMYFTQPINAQNLITPAITLTAYGIEPSPRNKLVDSCVGQRLNIWLLQAFSRHSTHTHTHLQRMAWWSGGSYCTTSSAPPLVSPGNKNQFIPAWFTVVYRARPPLRA